MFFPDEASHILTVASELPEATAPPSGDISTQVIGLACDFNVKELFFYLKSQILTLVSSEPLARINPFQEV